VGCLHDAQRGIGSSVDFCSRGCRFCVWSAGGKRGKNRLGGRQRVTVGAYGNWHLLRLVAHQPDTGCPTIKRWSHQQHRGFQNGKSPFLAASGSFNFDIGATEFVLRSTVSWVSWSVKSNVAPSFCRSHTLLRMFGAFWFLQIGHTNDPARQRRQSQESTQRHCPER